MQPIKNTNLILMIMLLAGLLFLPKEAFTEKQQVTEEDYARGQRLMSNDLNSLVMNGINYSGWLGNDRLWYNKNTPKGHRYLLFDLRRKSSKDLFDHTRLAKLLSKENKKEYQPEDLPFKRITFNQAEDTIDFTVELNQYSYHLKTGKILKVKKLKREEVRSALYTNRFSPDGKNEAYIKDYNLWIRDSKAKKEIQLTSDGIKDFGYGTNNAGWIKSKHPVLLWSPDSKRIATFQQDARGVGEMYLVSTNVGHPNLEAWKYPLPGDKTIFRVHRVIIHLNPLKVVRLKMGPDAQRSTTTDHIAGRGGKLLDAQWKEDGSKLAFVSTSRDHKTVTLRVADTETGEVRDILTESTNTFFESGFREANWRVIFESNQVLWFSKRDNWGHLYLYNLSTGKLIRQITKGSWNVKRIIKIDKKRGMLYFTGNNREPGNPYFDYFYRINMKGEGLKCLTPEGAFHSISLSTSGKYILDSFSTVKNPPIYLIRSLSGKNIFTLAKADISKLLKTGWTPPEVIKAKGRDGKTDLFGLLYKPSHFDSKQSYPIINYIYPGPQSGSVRGFLFRPVSGNQGLAELGFIVVAINGMGTPGRSKSFHDTYYGNMGDNTLPDQITVMKQLARRYPWIDIDRVGIYGHSGGGFASADAILRYPDFFDVAVSSSGNHDNRNYEAPWGEKWQGLLEKNKDGSTNYDNQANQLLAKNLKGKLLIVHGMLDDNVPPYSTLLVVQELIKANKDFDLLLFPNSRHGYRYRDYMTRRRWDYFVTHLLGVTPPKEFDFKKYKK
jgi:dipeptidyl aminopeptidase/acylaminoacyl peptidase